MYDASLVLQDKSMRPNERKVRDDLVDNKADWQYAQSARILQLAVHDLGQAWKNFFNPKMPNHERPKFKSRKKSRPVFKTDRAKIVDEKLCLDKPQGYQGDWYPVRLAEAPRWHGLLRQVTVNCDADSYYASLSIEVDESQSLPINKRICGIDANIGRFVYNDDKQTKTIRVLTDQLTDLYTRITLYQRRLARKRNENPKRFQSNNYRAMITKLQRSYQKVTRIQNDLIQKFTTQLIQDNGTIAIEDLDVQHMKMNKRLAKNLHRSQFGRFKQLLQYKSEWYGRKLVMVDRYYPSTQRCNECGEIKVGDEKLTLAGNALHRTKHHEYHCYACGARLERDANAVQNLIQYAKGWAIP
jgi:putative transposase